MFDIARGVFDVEKYGFTYPKCPVCRKPLTGVIVEKGDELGEWVLKKISEAGWHHTRCG